MATSSNPGTPVESFPNMLANQIETQFKPAAGAVKVLPLSSVNPFKDPTLSPVAPVPTPRRRNFNPDVMRLCDRRPRKLSPDVSLRFSSAFLDMDADSDTSMNSNTPSLRVEIGSLGSDDNGSVEKLRAGSYSPHLRPLLAHGASPYSSSENILQPELVASPTRRTDKSYNSDEKQRSSSDVIVSPALPLRKHSRSLGNPWLL